MLKTKCTSAVCQVKDGILCCNAVVKYTCSKILQPIFMLKPEFMKNLQQKTKLRICKPTMVKQKARYSIFWLAKMIPF